MATPRVTIDALPLKATPESDDSFVIQDSGVTKKTTVSGLATLIAATVPGTPGPAGPAGPTGAAGAPGATGAAGAPGAVGPAGPAGSTGAQGDPGAQGPQGTQGVQGADGAQGLPGSVGATGPAGATGATGAAGATGPAGPGVPVGGTTGQVLTKTSATDFATNWQTPSGGGGGVTDGDKGDIVVSGSGGTWTFDSTVVTAAAKTLLDDASTAAMKATLGVTAADVGLGNVTNTSDANKPVSTAQAAADALKYDKTGGAISGDVTVHRITGPAADNLFLNAVTGQSVRLMTNDNTRVFIGDTGVNVNVPMTLPADPANANEAANKNYVDTKAPLRQTIATSAASGYTLAIADEAKLLIFTAAVAITFTVPTNAAVAFPIGGRIDIAQTGTGKITFSPSGGVTVTATPSLVLRAQGSVCSLIKIATDAWLLTGDLT